MSFDLDNAVSELSSRMGFDADDSDEPEVETPDEIDEPEVETPDEIDEPEVEDGEANDEIDEPEVETPEPTVEARQAPKSWAKESHELWNQIPDAAKDYIEIREKQMLDGIEQYKNGYGYGESIDSAIAPFRESLASLGLGDAEIVHNLMTHHVALTSGTIEQRQKALFDIGVATGLIQPENPQEYQATHKAQELQARLDRLERENHKREYDAVTAQVEAFASDPKNEYFEEVGENIAKLLKTGVDLQTAYEQACWMNPAVRAKLVAKQTAPAPVPAPVTEDKRKAASVNVKQAHTQNGARPTGPVGSMRDTMVETMNKIKSRV